MRYHQCRLLERKERQPRQTVAWIEERGAKLDALVELKDPAYGSHLWAVTHVSKMSIEADALRTKQANDRDAFASLAK